MGLQRGGGSSMKMRVFSEEARFLKEAYPQWGGGMLISWSHAVEESVA